MKINLAEIRKNKGYTQEGLARKIGVCTSALAKWEQSKQMPNYDNLASLKNELGCSYDLLLNDEG